MIVKLRGQRHFGISKKNKSVTLLSSLGTVRTNNTRGVEFIFLFLNLMIAWRTKETH